MGPLRSFRRTLNARALTPLSDAARFAYVVLAVRYRNAESGLAFPSLETLAADLGCGVTKVKGLLQELVDARWIEKQSRGGGPNKRGTRYAIHVPGWIDRAEAEMRQENSGALCARDTETDSGAQRAPVHGRSNGTRAHSKPNSGASGPELGRYSPHLGRPVRPLTTENSSRTTEENNKEEVGIGSEVAAAAASETVGEQDTEPRPGSCEHSRQAQSILVEAGIDPTDASQIVAKGSHHRIPAYAAAVKTMQSRRAKNPAGLVVALLKAGFELPPPRYGDERTKPPVDRRTPGERWFDDLSDHELMEHFQRFLCEPDLRPDFVENWRDASVAKVRGSTMCRVELIARYGPTQDANETRDQPEVAA